MKAYWLNDGKPLPDGRYCRVTDLEDGAPVIKTYGRTQDEVYSKIERTMMTAQATLSQVKSGNGQVRQPAPPPAPGRRLTLTADEQMQATADLTQPGKAPAAVRRLLESATGVDLDVLAAREFEQRALAWQATHPELKDSLFNKKLISDNARMRVGGDLRRVDASVLELAYEDLKAGGFLVTEEELPANDNHAALSVPPGGTQETRTEQTRTGFATSHRSNRLGNSQPPQWKPKYTLAEIQKLPLKESERLLRTQDKDYREALDFWYPPQARALA